MEELRLLLERVSRHLRVKIENRVRRETIRSSQGFANIVGHTPDMEKLYRIISKAAAHAPRSDSGCRGTGKEIVAKAIHYLGAASQQALHPRRLRLPRPHID